MKKFKFRLQVVLDMRENELEKRRIEAAKILAVLNEQKAKLEEIIATQKRNSEEMESLYNQEVFDIPQVEGHRDYGLKLITDEKNQQRIIENTKAILEKKQEEVREAHKKAEILKKLKEKQEKQYYKDFLDSEIKETDDITSARFNIE
ncbi:MAG: flagellar export protein FliJ [bacterium]|nr:flagellar export protein FliJ [bacterium]